MNTQPRSELKNTGYEVFIGILSVLSIVNLVLAYAVRGNADPQNVLRVMNGLFSFIFLIDFTYRLATMEGRTRPRSRHRARVPITGPARVRRT